MIKRVTAVVLSMACCGHADVWSPMEFYIGLGNPKLGDTQSPAATWTFRRGAFNGELLNGMNGAVTCEDGFGLWGTPGGDFSFIPSAGPRLSPNESLDEGTGQYPAEFDGIMVIPGNVKDTFLVFNADGAITVPPLTLKAEMVYGGSDGVLVSVMTRIGGVNTTWLDSGNVPPGPGGYQQWQLFAQGGPTLQKGDRLWVQVNIKGNISGDWTNISLESEGCEPDCTGEGTLDLFDFLCFVNSFNNDEAYSDCDGNGVRDLFDFLCFVNSFNDGC
jgi:hypothetical protein